MSAGSVVLGLSGGVDSAAAALLLKRQGYTVSGVWLDFGTGSPDGARAAAAQLGIAFSVFPAAEMQETLVRAPFAEAYRRAETPSPCTVCNARVKLPALAAAADALGAEQIATGHYARIDRRSGRPLLRASGGDKDQSYMLALVDESLLGRLLLPLEGLTKPEIRALAREAGLVNAETPDSQDICFIPDGDYGAWLESRGMGLPPGEFTDADGNVLGPHRGLHRYTVGQRRGLGVPAESRLYVCALRPETNTVVLGPREALMTDRVALRAVKTGALETLSGCTEALVKLRSGPRAQRAAVCETPEGLMLRFPEPVRRPAPGQLAVAYDDEGFVLFAGTIC